jgi:hypothetical protein
MTVNTLISLLVVLACVGFLGWRGYERGVLRILQRVISVLSGYAASYFFAGTAAGFIGKIFSLHPFQSFLISAAVLLIGVTFIINVALSWFIDYLEIRKLRQETEEDEQEEVYIPGMIVGATLGCFLGLITVWLGSISFDAIQLNTGGAAALTARSVDPVRKVAGNMVGAAVAYAVEQKIGNDNLASDLVGKLVGDPVVVSQQMLKVSRSEELKNFFSDPDAKILMQSGNIDELQKQKTFQQLMKLSDTKDFFTILGTTLKTGNAKTQEEQAARLLTDMYQKARRLRSDPRFIELSEKPEFQQMIQNPSPLAMLSNPLMQDIADIVFSKKITNEDVIKPRHAESSSLNQDFQSIDKPQWQAVEPVAQTTSNGEVPAADDHVIYRWTDAQGQKHFSQQKPEGNYSLEIIKTR